MTQAFFIDSHCHIDGPEFDADRDEVVTRAREASVRFMLNVGTGDPKSNSFERAVEIAERYDCVFASVGVHPHDARVFDDEAEERLRGLVDQSKKVIAWGEIGFDYSNSHFDISVLNLRSRCQVKPFTLAARLSRAKENFQNENCRCCRHAPSLDRSGVRRV